MILSDVGICNVALSMIGQEIIRNYNEDNKRARLAENLFYFYRDFLLAKFDWPFARRVLKLHQVYDNDLIVPSGQYAFVLPEDCLTPRDIQPEGSSDYWTIANGYLVAKKSEVYLVYTASVENPALFSRTFANLLACCLATKMCMPLTLNKELYRVTLEHYQVITNEVWESDANIGNDYRNHDETPDNDPFVNPDKVAETFVPSDRDADI